MAGELAPSIINLMKHGDKYDQPVAAFASVAIGPTPQTRGLGHWLIDRAKDEPPGSELRANLAMVLWACCHQTDDAIEILIPLLDDQGWATTRSAWILGQMGRDGRAALPRLRQLAAGPNPAYANWVGEAVRLIETELRRKIEPAGAYEELADDDYLVSLRALWRMVDMGQPGDMLIKDRLAQDDTPRLPGAKLRQQARARQVLAVLEPAREISAATQVDQ
jgi:hypothetical protein